jgi:adenylate kinase family enzyme
MRRVSVVGNSGSGKTTIAVALAEAVGAPHLELDSVFHQPNWQPLDTDAFRAKVSAFVAADDWVVDGNYNSVRDLVWQRADTVVWLDLPRRRIMRQLIARTLRRIATRQELWNGNTERWRNLFRLDPEQSILRWAWTQHEKYAERYGAALDDPANAHLTLIRLTSPAAVARFVANLSPAQPGAASQPAGGSAGEQGGTGE